MPHDQMHWLKTLIFTHLRGIKAVASDQHNYSNNIKMIKGVHRLTLGPSMLISLIDQFTIFNGWMDSGADPGAQIQNLLSGVGGVGGGPGPTARIQDPHIGPTRTHTHTHTYIHTHVQPDRQVNVHAHADG